MKTETDFNREKYPEVILDEGRRERGWEKKRMNGKEKTHKNSIAWMAKRDER